MTLQEYNSLSKSLTISITDLLNIQDRTLVYGYDCDIQTYHLYIKDKLFYSLWYDHKDNLFESRSLIAVDAIDATRCIPNKRAYPDRCDLEFTNLLISRGFELCFTNFNEKTEPKKFYGLVI